MADVQANEAKERLRMACRTAITCEDRDAALHAVSKAVLAVTRHLSVREVLQVIVRGAASLLDARYAALGIPDAEKPDEDASFSEFIVEGVSDEEWARIGALPRQHGLLGAMLRDARAHRLTDVRKDPEFMGWPHAHPVLKDFLGVPIRDAEDVLGIIFLANKRAPGGFTDRDQELLELFAGHAAIAIINARLYERNSELTIISERSRLARELHDAVTQKLFSLRLTARTASALAGRDPDAASAALAQVETLAAEALDELRSVIFELRPAELVDDGLVESLRKHIEVLDRVHEAAVEFETDGEIMLAPESESVVFRIAQEALHNALRHSGADSVKVRLTRANTVISLEITDDGAGFDTNAERAGLGLTSMRDRAVAAGGSLIVTSSGESRTGTVPGTVVRLEVPVG